MIFYTLNLQLFADSGDSGAAPVGGAASSGTSDVASTEAQQTPTANNLGIPEHVMRKVYRGKSPETPVKTASETDAKENTAAKQTESAPSETKDGTSESEPTYEELIKSDKYKKVHERNIKRIVDDRVKNLNAENQSSAELLELVAGKYGLDPTSKTFKDDLKNAVENDEAYISKYAEEHDMSDSEAKRVLGMERKMQRMERERQVAERAEATRRLMESLRSNAKATKARFPEFDLDTMMQNEDFARMVGLTRGNTTAAYMALNYDAVLSRTARDAEAKGKSAVAESVKSNAQRPVENGIAHNATAVVKPDVKNMSLEDFKAVVEHYRKTGERLKF